MLSAIFKNPVTYIILTVYIFVFAWWLKISSGIISFDSEVYFFNWSYGFIPFFGAMYAIFFVAPIWGGLKSALGQAIIFISLGLLGQWLGLQIWTYYNLIARIEIPYPSLADIGYFALIPFYTFAALLLAKASGGKFSLRTKKGQFNVFIIPVVMLTIAYILFVKDLGFQFSDPLKTFLDYGYPLGEILPVSIALFILTVSQKLLGGTMRSRILYLVFAFAFQFLTEYLFLYAVSAETYTNGNINDILYATSYLVMSLGLISFKEVST